MTYDSNYFDKQFSDYDDMLGNAWGMNWRAYMHMRAEKASNVVRNFIRLNKNESKVLEIGCATGEFVDTYLDELIGLGGTLLGTDISPIAIDICRKKYCKIKGAQFEVHALPNIQLNQRYNCIVCIDVLEYFNSVEKENCIKNLLQLLSEDGSIILQMPLEGECVRRQTVGGTNCA